MQIPLRVIVLLRPSVAPGILLAVGFSTLAIVTTPFVIGPVADHYGVPLASASLIGVAQLSGFVIGSWGSGRWLRPRRRVFVAALALAVGANLASALLPVFPVLIALRFASGLALGLISWFAWVQVFGEEKGTSDVAVMGPVAGIISGPLIAVFAPGGADTLFAMLGAIAVVPLLFNAGTGAADRVPVRSARSKPVPAASLILIALGLFTLGGSSVFTFVVVLGGERAGLTVSTLALLFSINSVAAVPATKWPWRRGWPAPYMLGTTACALLVTNATARPLFAAAVVCWGFFFWMAVPGVFAALAARSANPADRAGDAQAIMAGGRVIGPFLGGFVLDTFGSAALGLVGATIMITAASVVFAVRSMVSPTDA
ncbi:MAG: MFS transporter [Actinomycetota bacterium]